jgi:hypothetical protein
MTNLADQESSSKKPLDEIKALQDVLSVLQELDQEVRERIIQTVLTFFNFSPTPALSASSQVRPSHSAEKISATFSEDRTISPKEFLMEKMPHTDVEKVACLAYYLTHYRDTPHFKTLDISKLNTDAAQRKFANATKAVNNATTYGYLAPATKGHKQLSAAGELFVQSLPDRLAAKEAMTHARPRRKSKASPKKRQSTETS